MQVISAITIMQYSYGMSMPNDMTMRRLRPLYTLAVYGMRNTKMIAAAAMRRARESKRLPKNSGIVVAPRRCVISRARGPSTHQASNEPMIALPIPAQVADRP